MKAIKFRKVNTFVSVLLYIVILILYTSCGKNSGEPVRATQTDTIPPVFSSVIFGDNYSAPEGVLVITGNLSDDTRIHETEPLAITTEVLGYDNSVLFTDTVQVGLRRPPEEHIPGCFWFDPETGDFRIGFTEYNKLKEGVVLVTLTGKDSASNTTTQTATVNVGPIDGIDPYGMKDARESFGSNWKEFLDRFKYMLEFYPNTYEYETAVLDELIDFLDSTYIARMPLDSWLPHAESMAENISEISNSQNPDIKYLIDNEILPSYIEFLKDEIDDAANPYYSWMVRSDEDKVENRLKQEYERNSFQVTTTESAVEIENETAIQMHFTMTAYDDWLENPIVDIADFTITSWPTQNEPLLIEGTLGDGSWQREIEPLVYEDSPFGLLAYLYERAAGASIIIY